MNWWLWFLAGIITGLVLANIRLVLAIMAFIVLVVLARNQDKPYSPEGE